MDLGITVWWVEESGWNMKQQRETGMKAIQGSRVEAGCREVTNARGKRDAREHVARIHQLAAALAASTFHQQ